VRELTRLAIEAARAGGAVVRKGFEASHLISRKGRRELVTDSDRASEEAIIGVIRSRLPEDVVIAEETAPDLSESGRVWIIDPLDGTNNYAHGYPFFCVAVALEEEGTLAAGVVFDPLRNELFAAERGGGATLNGRPIAASESPSLLESLVATGFPYERTDDSANNIANLNRFIMAARGIRRGGSAELDLVYVSCGRLDGFWEQGLKTWDVSAGGLIVKEAGGRVTNFGGAGWDHRRGDIVASNGHIHDEMLGLVE
jgi:myo-inositol-1(or 4)-monophosphatase